MQKQTGTSLIEILISLFLLSIILLGLDATGLIALRETKSAYYFAVASQQINNMIQQLNAAKNNDVTEQIMQWNKQNNKVLPQGKGTVTGLYPNYQVAIFWGSNSSDACIKNKIGETGCLQMTVNVNEFV